MWTAGNGQANINALSRLDIMTNDIDRLRQDVAGHADKKLEETKPWTTGLR